MTTGQLLTSQVVVNRWGFPSIQSPSEADVLDSIDSDTTTENNPDSDLGFMFQRDDLRGTKSARSSDTTYAKQGNRSPVSFVSGNQTAAAADAMATTPTLASAPEPGTRLAWRRFGDRRACSPQGF